MGSRTITNLKSATGIADNRLSAHAPGGVGTAEVSTNDFAVGEFGLPYDIGDWRQYVELVKVNGSTYDGSFQCLGSNNTVTLRLYGHVDVSDQDKSYWGEQIGQNNYIEGGASGVANATLQSVSHGYVSTTRGHEVSYIDLKYEFGSDAYDTAGVAIGVDDPFNSSFVPNNNSTMSVFGEAYDDGTNAWNSAENVNGSNQLILETSGPLWDYFEVTYESDPPGENKEYSAMSILHDPLGNAPDSDYDAVLHEEEDGADHLGSPKDPSSTDDTQNWGNSNIATVSGETGAESTLRIELVRESDNTVIEEVRLTVEWDNITVGNTVSATRDACQDTYTASAGARVDWTSRS